MKLQTIDNLFQQGITDLLTITGPVLFSFGRKGFRVGTVRAGPGFFSNWSDFELCLIKAGVFANPDGWLEI